MRANARGSIAESPSARNLSGEPRDAWHYQRFFFMAWTASSGNQIGRATNGFREDGPRCATECQGVADAPMLKR